MMPSTVTAITGTRSSQRSRSAACGGAAGDPPSIDLIIGRQRGSTGDAGTDSLAVGKAQRRPDLQAEPRKDDLRLEEVALHVCGAVPPEVVLRHRVAQGPHRDRAP